MKNPAQSLLISRIAKILIGGTACCLLFSSASLASDGVLEINQACAENTGCFSGDSPGFPVTITSPGSYRLTGSLVLADVNTSAIEISSLRVTIDLNRFELRGPVFCTGNGATLACMPSGTGLGISGGGGITIENGSIVGFGAGGILVTGVSLIREVRLLANNGPGMVIGERSRAVDCLSLRNAGDGINGGQSSELEGNMIANNLANGVTIGDHSLLVANRIWDHGGWGASVGNNSRVSNNTISASVAGDLQRANNVTEPLGNSCDNGCSADGKRLYYLTPGEFAGDQALTACEVGFHMASMYELLDLSGLRYDTHRGFTSIDSGQGPPTGNSSISNRLPSGWARTGHQSGDVSELTGRANCNAWTSGEGTDSGTSVSLWNLWRDMADPGDRWPWIVNHLPCNAAQVWCIQD